LLVSCADVALLSEPFDVVVIGAGVVGLFCPIQLEKHGLRVAVIEGGDIVPDTASNAAYTRLVGRPHRAIEGGVVDGPHRAGRAMGLGGTGLLWGGQLSEFSAADLDDDKGFWPVDYAGLRALYDRVNGLLHLPPRLADADARVQFGGRRPVPARRRPALCALFRSDGMRRSAPLIVSIVGRQSSAEPHSSPALRRWTWPTI
jgi:choline dehydrogenase-like flavoprotein